MEFLQLRGRRQIAELRKYCLVRVIVFFGVCFLYFYFSQVGNFGSNSLQLVSKEVGKASVIEKFDGTDFAYWRMQIEDYLYGRKLHLPLLGTKPETMKVGEWSLLDR